jgi:hypothetical protein
MTRGLTVTKEVHFRCAKRGRKVIAEGHAVQAQDPGSVPRVSRLMALAIHMEDLVRKRAVADYSELARLSHVSRARITQIMNFLHLAPDLQETLLCLPRSDGGRDSIREKMVRPLTAVADWRKQRRMWEELKASGDPSSRR